MFVTSLKTNKTIANTYMTSPEDIVWNTITDSAKTRFDYVTFESDFDDGTMAENILFLTIIGHAQGESVEHIASDISTQLLLLGLGLGSDGTTVTAVVFIERSGLGGCPTVEPHHHDAILVGVKLAGARRLVVGSDVIDDGGIADQILHVHLRTVRSIRGGGLGASVGSAMAVVGHTSGGTENWLK